MDDLQIVVQTVVDEIKSLQNIVSSLKKIGDQATVPVSAELDVAKSVQQLQSKLDTLEKLKVELTGQLDISNTRKALQKDVNSLSNSETVKIKAEIDESALRKNLKKEISKESATINVDANVDGAEDLKKVSDGLDSVNKKSAATVASVTLLNQALIELEQIARKMVQTSSELDEKLTDMRMATGYSYDEASELVSQYNILAKELGATTASVLEASNDWLRQGHTVSETNELIRDSMILSKVSNLESAKATEFLTSSMKSYQVAVEDVIHIVDKLTSVDLVSATDAGGLAEAMSKTAVSASYAGVEMDRLLGYLAAVGEVTQDSMSSVGNAFKTFFARYSDIKAGKLELIDEDGTTEMLSDVEQSLKNVGIDIRSTITEFDDMGDALDDLHNKWDTLSSTQQNAIAKAFGGTRQKERFLVLMENYDKAAFYMETAANSAGTATEKFGAYMESLASKVESFKASFESISMNTFDAQFLGSVVEAGTLLLAFVDNINLLKSALIGLSAAGIVKGFTVITQNAKNAYNDIIKLSSAFNILGRAEGMEVTADQMQNLLSVTKGLNESQLRLIVTNKALSTEQRMAILTSSGLTREQAAQTLATMGLTTAEQTATTATFSLSGAMKALGAAIAANPIGFLATTLTAAVSVITTASNAIREAKEESIRLAQESRKASLDEANAVKEAYVAYMQFADKQALATNEESAFESAVDKVTTALQNKTTALSNLTAGTEEYTAALQKATLEELKQALRDAKDNLSDVSVELQELAYSDWFGGLIGFELTGNPEKYGEAYAQAWNIAQNALKEYSKEHSATKNSSWYKVNPNAYDAGSIADYYLTLLDLKNQLNDADLIDTDIYKDVKSIVDGLSKTVDEYIQQMYEVASNDYSTKNGIPTTIEEFTAYRDYLNDVLSEDIKYDDLSSVIDNYLADEADAYSGWINQLTQQTSEMEGLVDQRKQLLENISTTMEAELEKTTTLVEGLTAAQEVLNSQATGVSMSLNDFNSEELSDYNSALEYNNGALQLNAEKVNEIVQAKAKEQIAINNANKAISQAEYLKNAAEIEKLRNELDGLSDTEVDARNAIQSKIDTLLSENDVLRDSCTRYDLMSASIREATSAYQHWLNAQNASQSGDMFDEALNAITHINDTLNNTKSDLYGRVGRTDYQAAVDFIVPDTVDKEDSDAVNAYMKSIGDMFLYDGDGGFVGLNIENFCREAVDAGLMELNDAGTAYQIAGRKTMEDFADGLGLALPLVQAMFGEMEEFGGSFDWADEANKTIGDLGVSATVAAEALRSIKGNESLRIDLDVSDIEGDNEKIVALSETIAEMQNLKKTKVGIDASEIEYANQIIEYCVAQKLQLENPAVLDIDLTKLSDSAAEAVSLMQEFKTAYNELELQKSLGLDITDAQANVENLRTQIESSENAYLISLELDSTSVDTLNSTITSLEMPEIKTVFGIDDSALLSYEADNKEATVVYGVDHSAVDAYSPSDLHRTVYYYYKTVGSPPSGGGDSELNGTAHASGTAKASGDWGTAPGGKTLLGELGLEIVVDPHTGKWYTVGETGAEFVNIPRGAIVFNHKQSESLLRSGYVAGRGTAHAYGTAAVSGFMPVSGITSNKYHGTSGGYSGSSTSTSDSSSSNDNTANDTISEFERLYKEHQHLLAMDKESLEAYTRWLSDAYVDAYAQGQIELEDYYKYAEEVYENMQDIFMDSLDDAEHQIDLLEHEGNNAAKIELIYRSLMSSVEKEIAAAKANGLDETDDYVQELQQKWMSYSKEIMDMQEDAADDAKSSVEDLVDYRVDMLKQELKDQQDALDDKLDNLKEFYDKQKEMLQKQYDEEKVIEERNEKRKAKSDIEAELAKLEFDDSAWAQKRKLELQAELASAEKDLADFEKDQALKEAQSSLDIEYAKYAEALYTELDEIEEKLNNPNALYNQALSDIVNNTESLYGEMVEYNNKHGDGNPDTAKEMWEEAFVSLNNYLHLFGEAYKGIILTNATGYASGTSSATAGWHRFDEDGSEYIMARQGGGKYRLFSDRDKVLSAPASSWLYNLAESKGGVIDSLVNEVVGNGSYNSRENIRKIIQNISNDSITNNNLDMSGDIIIQGNTNEKTVSEIRREKRELINFILHEFKKLSR